MKRNVVVGVLFMMLFVGMTGCDNGGGGTTSPANAPVLSTVVVRPNPASPGSTIVFEINFVDVPGDLNGETAFISDGTNTYQGLISNAEGGSGTLVTSMTLSPLLSPGNLVLSIFVQDRAGNTSNKVYVTLSVTAGGKRFLRAL